MVKFLVAVSRAENWSSAAKELETALVDYRTDGDEVQLGWLYVTDVHAADLSSMHTYLRQKTGIEHWVGSVGMGICWHDGVGDVGEAFDRPAAVAMVSGHPRDSFMLLPRLGASESSSSKKSTQAAWPLQREPRLQPRHLRHRTSLDLRTVLRPHWRR